MFGLEAWHGFVLASLVLAGVHGFVIKVASERAHGSKLLNTIAAAVATACSLFAISIVGFDSSAQLIVLASITGALYVFGTLARSDALAFIHTTLFFPVYKIVGPVIVLASGLLFFGDRLTSLQWLGFFLALLVPVLLIDRAEHGRQKNLVRGLWLALWSAVFISVGQVIVKVAASGLSALYTFLLFDYLVTFVGISILSRRANGREERSRPSAELYAAGIAAGVLQFLAFASLIAAYSAGPISTIYAINSTYIVIPIILSVLFYGEHWNWRKVAAIALSVVAVVLLR